MSDVDASRKIAVILVADVVGYSKHMEQDEKATLEHTLSVKFFSKIFWKSVTDQFLILLGTLF